ncbi:MAG: tetratricopeptide repeat protein [Chitinispirillaceae bacterium]|nr:tetratricopeptide repeat protein [Chitinispirillaceae bacterium]
MLQIRLIIVLLLSCLVVTSRGQAERLPTWMMEDAFDDEYIQPFDIDVIAPEDVQAAYHLYKNGNYKEAMGFLKKIRNLSLPDGRLDFFIFIIAECNRMLKLKDIARQEYSYIATRYPQSDKCPPSIYRLLELAVNDDDLEVADSLYHTFAKSFSSHPLMPAVEYTAARAFFVQKKYESALPLLTGISSNSVHSSQARFLTALCLIGMKEYDKAIGLLDIVINSSKKKEMVSEAKVIAGDINCITKNYTAAQGYYSGISDKSSRYTYSMIKTAKVFLDLKRYKEAEKLARKFLRKEKKGDSFFEMASILEQVYTAQKKDKDAARVENLIHKQLIDSRIIFELYEERDKLTDIAKTIQNIEYEAIRNDNRKLKSFAEEKKKRTDALLKKSSSILSQLNISKDEDSEEIPHWAERRYFSILKKEMSLYEDSISSMKNEIEMLSATTKTADETSHARVDSLEQIHRMYTEKFDQLEHEFLLVEKECFGPEEKKGSDEEDMQVRFVDWSFIKYQDRNKLLISQAQKISDLSRAAKTDTLHADSIDTELKKERMEYDKTARGISDDRIRLINHIHTMLEVYPRSKYNADILFRLAELKFDFVGERFQVALREYEKAIVSGKDSAGLQFPEYNLDTVVMIYDDILQNYPLDDLSDDACFYKAMALQKQGLNDDANDAFLELTEKYSESEYYTEANMNIGRYYFDHPKIENGQGYKLAEDAYRKVLFFRDHPQYVQALYHLGWCYYMQDRYEEAIAAFKFLIEENKLDFDPSKMDEQQVVNPLLRGEAIDYIAISFDEGDRMDDAIKFLQLIGNQDYGAMVLKRMAELREEDLDYDVAASVYKRLLTEYGMSTVAPEASMNLIKLYEARNQADSAMYQRELFYNMYSTGSPWNLEMAKDSSLIQYIDSLSIVMGLYVADAQFRKAEASGNSEDYVSSVNKYGKVTEKYSKSPLASEALWNMAAIQELKMGDKPAAYTNYLKFSRLTSLDSIKREQAALNAVALAQSIMPLDTAGQTGSLDFAAKKVVEAVDNYRKLFPSGNASLKVMMSQAAVYYNRQIYDKAAEIYSEIIKSSANNKDILCEAMLFLGQCRFGEEKWSDAAEMFENVYRQSTDEAQRGTSYKLLLQSKFQSARNVMSSGEYEKAATLFKSIDDQFPNSEYGDIVLFNAAESYEKLEKWSQAGDAYLELVKRYPASKYAPDALFNAALDFEKCDRITKAAESYETIVYNYSTSDKAKDALFNLGFCYEKMGKMDKMAEVNERYSSLYPGEKDVEAMLLRSASFYARTGMYEKAVVVYKNFIRRYPKSPKAIEALFMIAKCQYDQNDFENALLSFNNAEQQNSNFILEKLEPNNYYAGEAAYYSGLIKRDRFAAVKLSQPPEVLKNSIKEKSDLLNEASKSFQRVIQYQSERMFEAAYRVGELYEDLTVALQNQERPKLDPIQNAVNEKEIMILCFKIIQNTFVPYSKTIEIASGFDSLAEAQRSWVTKSKVALEKNLISAGKYLINAVMSVQNAPIPKEIKEKPLHYFQYQKQILETLDPLKLEILNYYMQTLHRIDSLKLGDSITTSCKEQVARVAYQKGRDYDNLATQILKGNQNLPSNMDPDEKEDLIFQLEDIVFELQDKAILLFEDALRTVKSIGMETGVVYKNIIEHLAKLNPDKYGASFYARRSSFSDDSWIVRSDSVANWNGQRIPQGGWTYASKMPSMNVYRINKDAIPIWGDTSWSDLYALKNIFLDGIPRDGSIYLKKSGKYKLYVNNVLILSDTIGNNNLVQIDSATGITSLLKGGDNIFSIAVKSENRAQRAFAMLFTALIDTTQKYQSTVKFPEVKKIKVASGKQDSRSNDTTVSSKEAKTVSSDDKNTNLKQKDVLLQIEQYRSKEAAFLTEIRKERLEIQKLKIKIDAINKKHANVKSKNNSKSVSPQSKSR